MHDTSWVDRTAYPFQSHYFDVDGARMHYIDEGEGEPVVFVHGTSAWSFVYRNLIKPLIPGYRCIAPDHLGYGLSDKPVDASYQPEDHARRLRALIEHLGLRNVTLVVHDFGGPIGLSYAVEQPENVRSLVVFNTWMWSLRGEPVAEVASLTGGGLLGRLFVKRLNLEILVLFKAVWGDRSKLDRALHQQYIQPFARAKDRESLWVLARALTASTAWFEGLWNRRDRIQNIPALLLWGKKDVIFRPRHLKRWQALFASSETVMFPGVGHFVQEEAKDELGEPVLAFLQKHGGDG